MHRPSSGTASKNSLIVVSVTVALSMVLAFLAAVALAKFRFTGRKALHRAGDRDPDDPAGGPDHPALRRARAYHQVNALIGVIVTYMTFVLPFSVWVLRGFCSGSRTSSRRRRWSTAGRRSALLKILLPLVAPGLVATSIFAFIPAWNEYIFARVLLNEQSKQTATVWLSYFSARAGNGLGRR